MSVMFHGTKVAGSVPVDATPTAGSSNAVQSDGVKTAINGAVANEILYIAIPAFSTLPLTITNPAISSEHVVLEATFGVPQVRTRAWTVVTSNGSLTIQGTGANYDEGIIGETSMTLKLGYTGTYFSG